MPAGADGRPGGGRRIRIIGDDLLSVAAADAMTGQALAAALRESGDWLEAVAGIDTVVVRFDNLAVDARRATERLEAALAVSPDALEATGEAVEIPVVYGGEHGPDLDAVCRSLGIPREEFVLRHTARLYRVELLGFTPGFAYLGDPDPDLDVPRRETPRQRVPAGSVGIAGGRTGLYALAGPGGWSIVGRTPLQLFDAEAREPFLLRAGMDVRFRAADADTFRDGGAA